MGLNWIRAALLVAACGFGAPAGAAVHVPVDYLSIEDLKYAIQVAIAESIKHNDTEPYFLITKVDVTLKGSTDVNVEGGFKIPIFGASVGFGGEIGSVGSETVEFPLVPAQALPTRTPPRISLSQVVASMKAAFQAKVAGPDAPGLVDLGADSEDSLPVLTTPGFVYTSEWALKFEADGSFDVLFVTLGADAKTEYRQVLVFHLCRTENMHNCVPQD